MDLRRSAWAARRHHAEAKADVLLAALRAPGLRQPATVEAAYAAVVVGQVGLITALNEQIAQQQEVVAEQERAHRVVPTRQRGAESAEPSSSGTSTSTRAIAVTFGWLYSTAGEKVPVVVITEPVAVGEVIDRSDLSTTDVAGELTAIAGANLESVVGQRSAVGLLPGTILQRSMLTDADPTPADLVQVGVAVTGGRLPAGGVVPGDRVQVLALPVAGATGPEATAKVVASDAQVFTAIPDPTRAGGTLLTVLVPPEQSAAVVAASGADTAAVVKVRSS